MSGQLDMFAEAVVVDCQWCKRPLIAGKLCSGCNEEPAVCHCLIAGQEPPKVTPTGEQSSSQWSAYSIYWLNGEVVVEEDTNDGPDGPYTFESVTDALEFTGISRQEGETAVMVKFQGEEVDEVFAERLRDADR